MSQPDPCPACHYNKPSYVSVCRGCPEHKPFVIETSAAAPRQSKYNAKKTVVNGVTYDSKKEAKRGCDLAVLEARGEISQLRRQVSFPLELNGVNLGSYRADFCYLRPGAPGTVVEDVKGFRTAIYRLKKKLMLALYGIEIEEV